MFHVYVDGVLDPAPEAARAVADEMALLYGVAADELHARLLLGPFRVKANVDAETAESYAHDLAVIGARVRIEPAQAAGAPPVRSPLPPQPSRASPSVLPPRTVSRPVSSALSAAAASRAAGAPLPAPGAAGSGTMPAVQLGALAGERALALGSLDGGAPAPVKPPGHALPASMGPPALPASMGPPALRASGPPARAPQAPVDLFAPPDAGAGEVGLELADDELEPRARRSPAPPAPARRGSSPSLARAPEPQVIGASGSSPRLAVAAEPPVRGSSPGLDPPMGRASPDAPPATTVAVGPVASALRPVAASPRLRLAAGVVLAIVLGFLPAHVVASVREARALDAIDAKLIAAQRAADTQERYEALDALRAQALADKRRARRDIALVSLVIWAAAGGALGYGWFRRVPWDRLG